MQLSVEASVGVVVAPAGAADMTELLRRADIAMYQAKEGGGSVAWYDSARDEASTDQLALLAELREALAVDDQLVLALQPAVDLATGAPTGVEALIRWRHPRRGALGPSDFVRAVEGSELLAAFTRYVIDKALAVAAEWARPGRAGADLGQPVGPQPARPAPAGRRRRAAAPPPGAAAAAGPGDHRDGGDERDGGHRRGAGRPARPWACSWPSTTSAPASRR